MAYENSLSTRKYGASAILAARVRKRHSSADTGDTSMVHREVTPEQVLNMDFVRSLGLPDEYVDMYQKVLVFCRGELSPYSEDYPYAFSDSNRFVVVDLKGILENTYPLRDYFKVDGTFLLQRFLRRFPTLDDLKMHVASCLEDCPPGRKCDGFGSSCVNIGGRCVTKKSVTDFHTTVGDLREFDVLDSSDTPNEPIRIGKYIQGFYYLLNYPKFSKDDYVKFMNSKRPS